jgi:outer membrane immunogenic protein
MKRTTLVLLSMLAASGSVFAVENWQGLYTDLRIGAGFNPGDNGELEFRRADGSDNRAAIDSAFGDNFNGEFNAGSDDDFDFQTVGAALRHRF